ncbi:Uncharacterised protein [Flavonifractor plautii]|uniref:Uncharacterized protein n=1 Tax=Flavonifractor plautii TaxID=292800 RepID=A0A6N2Y587_FLAPL
MAGTIRAAGSRFRRSAMARYKAVKMSLSVRSRIRLS